MAFRVAGNLVSADDDFLKKVMARPYGPMLSGNERKEKSEKRPIFQRKRGEVLRCPGAI
jgi:hypothetical protein